MNDTYVHHVELEAAEGSEGAGNGTVQMDVSFLEDGSFEVEVRWHGRVELEGAEVSSQWL